MALLTQSSVNNINSVSSGSSENRESIVSIASSESNVSSVNSLLYGVTSISDDIVPMFTVPMAIPSFY